MKGLLIQRLAAIFCLLAFGFQTMAGAGLVLCTDGKGFSILEWMCDRDDAGRCLTPPSIQLTSPNDLRVESAKCVDVPVSVQASASVVGPDGRANPVLPAVAILSRLFSVNLTPPCDSARTIELRTAASPPAFAFSQSIVMLI